MLQQHVEWGTQRIGLFFVQGYQLGINCLFIEAFAFQQHHIGFMPFLKIPLSCRIA